MLHTMAMKLYITLEIGDESENQTLILTGSVILIQLRKLFTMNCYQMLQESFDFDLILTQLSKLGKITGKTRVLPRGQLSWFL